MRTLIDYQQLASYAGVSAPGAPVLRKPLVALASVLAGRTETGRRLQFFERFLNLSRAVCLHLLHRNGLGEYFALRLADAAAESIAARLRRCLVEVLCQTGMAAPQDDTLRLRPSYARYRDFSLEPLLHAFGQGRWSAVQQHLQTAPAHRLLRDVAFMLALAGLRRGQAIEAGLLQRLGIDTRWVRRVSDKTLDYEIRLSEVILELRQTNLREKLVSTLSEAYFTESGRLAFAQFTQPRFLEVVAFLAAQRPLATVLDIGCGYGDYIAALLDTGPWQMTGIERQVSVFAEARRRFTGNSRVCLVNQDVLEYQPEAPLDLVLLNYVLPYLSRPEQEQLFRQLYQWLRPSGTVLVGQYYPGLEVLKEHLARALGDTAIRRRIERYYANLAVSLNAFSDEAFSLFQSAARWEPFMQLLSDTGFEVAYLTPADRYYYSLFVVIRKRQS
jgi:trans-aconitate methyltransferase